MAIKIKKKKKSKLKIKKKYKPTKREVERRRRINVALWAYAYEVHDDSLVSDGKFDETCLEIDLSVNTGDRRMDIWFKNNFFPDSGVWVHKHPHLDRLEELYQSLKEARK